MPHFNDLVFPKSWLDLTDSQKIRIALLCQFYDVPLTSIAYPCFFDYPDKTIITYYFFYHDKWHVVENTFFNNGYKEVIPYIANY